MVQGLPGNKHFLLLAVPVALQLPTAPAWQHVISLWARIQHGLATCQSYKRTTRASEQLSNAATLLLHTLSLTGLLEAMHHFLLEWVVLVLVIVTFKESQQHACCCMLLPNLNWLIPATLVL
jgi:hypothetical protein